MVAAVVFICLAIPDGHTQARVRILGYTLEPIVNQLLPDDEVVVIERSPSGVQLDHDPTASEAIVDAVSAADVVAVVDVEDVASILVDNGTWIRTQLAGRVREVVRTSNNRKFSLGQRIQMQINGGEVRIGNVLVKAYPLRLPVGRPYLWFMMVRNGFPSTDGASTVPSAVYRPLLIDDGRLIDTWIQDSGRSIPMPLNGLQLSDVKREILPSQIRPLDPISKGRTTHSVTLVAVAESIVGVADVISGTGPRSIACTRSRDSGRRISVEVLVAERRRHHRCVVLAALALGRRRLRT